MAGRQAEWGIECTVGPCILGLLIPEPSLFFPAAAPGPLEGKRERSRRMVLLIQLTKDNLPSNSHPWVLVFMDLNFKPLVGEAWNMDPSSRPGSFCHPATAWAERGPALCGPPAPSGTSEPAIGP